MKIVPLMDRVVLQKIEVSKTTSSGIILTSNTNDQSIAKVIAVGNGGVVDGNEVKMIVHEGQKVIYSKYAATEVELDHAKYIIIKQSDILAILEDE